MIRYIDEDKIEILLTKFKKVIINKCKCDLKKIEEYKWRARVEKHCVYVISSTKATNFQKIRMNTLIDIV